MRSTTCARLAREASWSISARVTAAVERRSSQKINGRLSSGAIERTKARVACARGPSLESILSGRPITKAATSCLFASSISFFASAPNLVRAIVSSGEASVRSTSDRPRPMVFVPRSSPIRREKRPNDGLICSSVETFSRLLMDLINMGRTKLSRSACAAHLHASSWQCYSQRAFNEPSELRCPSIKRPSGA